MSTQIPPPTNLGVAQLVEYSVRSGDAAGSSPAAQTNMVNTNITSGSYTVPLQPNVCPGCGRCRQCGQPYQPYFQPYTVPYTQPYWQPYQPYWEVQDPFYTHVTCTTAGGVANG